MQSLKVEFGFVWLHLLAAFAAAAAAAAASNFVDLTVVEKTVSQPCAADLIGFAAE